ncbi:MAG: hypothetical protein ACLFVS_04135 [Candidatus Acetothermia bacterium]
MESDFACSIKNLVPEDKRKKYSDAKMDRKNYSCSTFMLYLGLDKVYDDLEHHNVLISEDYRRNFEEVETKKILPGDPSLYVQNPSVTDSTLAPKGHSTLYVLVLVPNLKGEIDWEEEKEGYRRLTLSKLESDAGLNRIEDHIDYERIITPEDWKGDFNVGYGATFNRLTT